MRKPTIAYVQEFEEALVKDAIERELARDESATTSSRESSTFLRRYESILLGH